MPAAEQARLIEMMQPTMRPTPQGEMTMQQANAMKSVMERCFRTKPHPVVTSEMIQEAGRAPEREPVFKPRVAAAEPTPERTPPKRGPRTPWPDQIPGHWFSTERYIPDRGERMRPKARPLPEKVHVVPGERGRINMAKLGLVGHEVAHVRTGETAVVIGSCRLKLRNHPILVGDADAKLRDEVTPAEMRPAKGYGSPYRSWLLTATGETIEGFHKRVTR